jgi:dynein intermediate chain, cytosolic
LKTFGEFEDYVSDVAWCPTHPAVFATVDASGNMDIFNLNQADTAIGRTTSSKSLNKVDWNSNGELVATAGLDGSIDVFDTSKVLATNTAHQISAR